MQTFLASTADGKGAGGRGWRRKQATDGCEHQPADPVPPAGGVHGIYRGSGGVIAALPHRERLLPQ